VRLALGEGRALPDDDLVVRAQLCAPASVQVRVKGREGARFSPSCVRNFFERVTTCGA
jgi:hypothetical protein